MAATCESLQTLQEIDNIQLAKSITCDCTELEKHTRIHKTDFNIITQNIRSIYCNFDNFLLTLSSLKFETDIIILTECQLNLNKPIPQLDHYNCYYTTNLLNRHDGVVAYVKKTLKHKVTEVKLLHASCLQIEVSNNIVFGVYRSPANLNADNFIDSLSLHLESLNVQKRNIVITGDININLRAKDTEQCYERKNRTNYLTMLSSYGILAGHTLPTREMNCLDHFMLKINPKKNSAFIAILRTTTTDHYTIFLSLARTKDGIAPVKIKTTIDFDNALLYLQSKNLAELLFIDDPGLVTSSLIEKITESLTAHTHTITIPSSKRLLKPWITQGILRCIRNRNALQKKAQNEPHNEIAKMTYTRYRNYCNNLIKKLKRKYNREQITNAIKNNRLLWKNIKNITYTNESRTDNLELLQVKSSPIESANFINNYFASIGSDLAQNITSGTNLRYKRPSKTSVNISSMVLLDTDLSEVCTTLMNLRSDSAPGWDNIPTAFLKHAKNEVVPVITYLANLCFQKGIFPASLKKSIITPVYKGGNRDDVNNYRPISVLTAISKVIEKLINTRLLQYVNKFNILSPSQFGFRQKKSTEDAVIALSSLVTEQLDKGNKCMATFLDLKKAFDTVSVPILLHKLEAIGIRGIPLALFRDYLSGRTQKVKLGLAVSEDADVSYGVPQGSVLGPTLFLIYINDLCNMRINNAKVFSYADDTAVVFSGKTWAEVKNSAEEGLALVATWLANNLLTLNASKTNFICFNIYNQSQPDRELNLRIHTCDDYTSGTSCNCPTIQQVTNIKYLGVIIDQRLSWYPQLENIMSRVRKLIWIFKELRYVVPRRINVDKDKNNEKHRNLLNEIYVSLVQSVLIYCIPVWGGATKSSFLELERAQRAILKVMYFKKRIFSTENLYKLCNLLSVRQLYILLIILKMHKETPYDPKILKKRKKYCIVNVPRTKTEFASRQYTKRSAFLYNKINKYIYIHDKKKFECKKLLTSWLHNLNYNDTELLLQRMT